MNINERIEKILASLEHTSEDLLALSDDIWINIEHNSDEALEAGIAFKKDYNAAMAQFASVAAQVQKLVEQYATENIPVRAAASEPRNVTTLYTNERYPLTTDLAYLRPIGFEVEGEGTLGLNTWRKVYEALCRKLAQTHTNFDDVATADAFLTNRNNRYFDSSPLQMRTASLVAPGVYAEVHFSANNMRDRMIDLLEYFGHDTNRMWLFLREDRDA